VRTNGTHTDRGTATERGSRRSFLRRVSAVGATLVAGGAATGSAAAGDFGGDNGDIPIPDDYPMVTTRGHFDGDADLTSGNTRISYGSDGDWGKWFGRAPTEEEVVVAVHGWNVEEPGGADVANTTRVALRENGYDNPVVGYTWDADEGGGFDLGWNEAVEIARGNGPKLAQWIDDWNEQVGDPVRIIGHSLGARVTVEALAELASRGRTNAVRSATLLGGAIDDQEVETDEVYGGAIEQATGSFFNFYNTEDGVLDWAYSAIEWDSAVGQLGIQDAGDSPDNYVQEDVTAVVPDHNSYYEPGDGCIPQVVDAF